MVQVNVVITPACHGWVDFSVTCFESDLKRKTPFPIFAATFLEMQSSGRCFENMINGSVQILISEQ